MKDEREIKEIAEEIVQFEKNGDIKGIEKIAKNLSMEQMFQVDEYITEKKLLNK